MSLPHIAPIGALRTQAGVKRSETPVKRSRQQNRVPKERQKFCRPYRGLQYTHTSFAGVSLRSTTCLCSIAPIGACNLLVYPLQWFRSAPPPACVLSPLSGLAICSYILCRGSASLHHLPVFYRPYRGLQSARISFAVVSLRSTTCLCSIAPIGACNLLVYPLQGFRFAPPPACNPNAPIGACNLLVYPLQGFRFAAPPASVLSPLSGLAITIRINIMPMSILWFPYELRIVNYQL